MALHKRNDIRDQIDVDIYGTVAANVSVPKYRLPTDGLRADVAHALVSDELILNGNARQNPATFCSTYLDTEVNQLMDVSIDMNMIDKYEHPATAELEKRLRPYSRRFVECAEIGQRNGLFDHRLERSRHAGRPCAEAQVARTNVGGWKADRQAQRCASRAG